jgi:O-antigen ligase
MVQTIERGTSALMVAGALIMALSAPISLSLFALGSVLLIFGWLVSGKWGGKIESATSFAVTIPLVIFVAYAAATALYSDGEWSHTVRVLSSYLKLLLIPILLSIAVQYNLGERLLTAFYASCVLLLLLVWLDLVINIPWSQQSGVGVTAYHNIFMTYISQGMALNACAVLAWYKGQTSGTERARYLHKMIVLLAFGAVFALNGSRIGYITGLGVAVLVAVGWWRRRGAKRMVAALLLGMVLVFLFSPQLVGRVVQVFNDLMAYESADTAVTSSGTRLGMALYSLDLIREAPIFGHGLGDYRTSALKFFAEGAAVQISAIAPTNQFLFIGVEMGLVGVALFVWLLFVLLKPIFRATLEKKLLGVGLFWIFFVDAMGHHPIWDAGERQLSLIMLCLIALQAHLSSEHVGEARP